MHQALQSKNAYIDAVFVFHILMNTATAWLNAHLQENPFSQSVTVYWSILQIQSSLTSSD